MLQSFARCDQTPVLLMIIVRLVGSSALVHERCWFIHQLRDWSDHSVTPQIGLRRIRGDGFGVPRRGTGGYRIRVWRSIRRLVLIERGLEGRRIHDRFENRTRLPGGLCDAVVLTCAVTSATDHRLDLAGVWIQRNKATSQYNRITQ